ncbi:MAG TPA: GNAT family N-acetyltransferase [Tepidisphaeraceae bacterium]|nr:GNAT family N-acetyltransferase [Tepidisphaeraceae bacterium]
MPEATPEFVTATLADAEELKRMMARLYEGEGFQYPSRAPAALDVLLREPNLGRCFLIRQGSQTVGYLVVAFGFSLEFGGRDAFLDELFIVPEARARGIGKRTVQFAADFCRAEGIDALHLEVSGKNAAAQRLYRGAGFRERHPDYDLLTLRLE